MSKINFEEKDILVLDKILELLCEKSHLSASDLANAKILQWNAKRDLEELNKEFDHYAYIINNRCATLKEHGFYQMIHRNESTIHFRNNGGFKKLYKDFLEEQYVIEKRQSEEDSLRKLQINEIKRNKKIAIVALIVSVISILISILK